MDDQTAPTEQSMKRIMQMREVMPDDADPRIASLYKDVRETLRVPLVNLLFRSLANYPDYLERAWRLVRDLASTVAFEQAADRLRRDAVSNEEHQPQSRLAHTLSSVEPAQDFIDTVHYVAPKLLLVATAMEIGSFGGTSGGAHAQEHEEAADGRAEHNDFKLLPRGIAQGTGAVRLAAEDSVDEHVKAIFKAIKRQNGHETLPSFYRGLANWPDVLETAWCEIAGSLGSEDYEERKRNLVELAERYVMSWPMIRIPIVDDKRDEIRAVLSVLRLKRIPETLLDVALVKREADGDRAARVSRFSLTCAAETLPR